jgi:cell division septal protein FtsQ
MAYNLNPTLRHDVRDYIPETMQFQRGKSKVKTKRIQRKSKMKLKHILFYFILLGGIFYGVQRTYLFLISWDKLDVKNVEVVSSKPEIREEIQRFLEGKYLGNILLLDISLLQEKFTAHRWIKEVRVRKILPSTLEIEAKVRSPIALLKLDDIYLIDREGVLLEKIEKGEKVNLPLLIDSNKFQKDRKEKFQLAWECLDSLSPVEKEQVEVLDLTEYENISARLKNCRTALILGDERFSQKLRLFSQLRARLERFGELEYIDLRFHDRLYIKPVNNHFRNTIIPSSNKEAF